MLHAGSVLPKDPHLAMEAGHPLLDLFKLLAGSLRQTQDKLLDVAHAAEFGQHGVDGRLLELRIQGGEHQGDGLLAREVFQLPFQNAQVAVAKTV